MRMRHATAIAPLPALLLLLPLLLALPPSAAGQGFQIPAPPGPAVGTPPAAAPANPPAVAPSAATAPAATRPANPAPAKPAGREITIKPWPVSGTPVQHTEIEGLPSMRLSRLAHDAERDLLYIGTLDAGVIVYDLEKRAVKTTFDPSNLLPEPCVRSLLWDERISTLYVGTDRGLHLIGITDGPPRREATVRLGADPLADVVTALGKFNEMQSVLAGTVNGVFLVNRDGSSRRVDSPTGALIGRVHHMKAYEDGLYVTSDTGIHRTRDGADYARVEKGGDELPPMATDVARRGEEELVWATLKGVGRRVGGERGLVNRRHGLPAEWITAVEFDRFRRPYPPEPGSFTGLWVGTRDAGLAVGDGTRFAVLDAASGMITDDHVTDLLAVEGAVYVATDGGGLNRYAQVKRLGVEPEIIYDLRSRIRSLASRDGALFVATDEGLFKIRDLVVERLYTRFDSKLPDNEIRDLCFDDADRLWMTMNMKGLGCYDFEKDEFILPKGLDALPTKTFTRVFMVRGQGMHFLMDRIKGRIHEKIGRITEEDAVERYTVPDAMLEADYDATRVSLDTPTSALLLPERGFVGQLGREPLARFEDGRFAPVTEYRVPPVYDIAAAGRDRFYFGTAGGLLVLDGTRYEMTVSIKPPDDDQVRLSHVEVVIPDPEVPDGIFFAANNRDGAQKVTGLFATLSPAGCDARYYKNFIVDIEYLKPFIVIATEWDLRMIRIVEAEPDRMAKLRENGYVPGGTITVPEELVRGRKRGGGADPDKAGDPGDRTGPDRKDGKPGSAPTSPAANPGGSAR